MLEHRGKSVASRAGNPDWSSPRFLILCFLFAC